METIQLEASFTIDVLGANEVVDFVKLNWRELGRSYFSIPEIIEFDAKELREVIVDNEKGGKLLVIAAYFEFPSDFVENTGLLKPHVQLEKFFHFQCGEHQFESNMVW